MSNLIVITLKYSCFPISLKVENFENCIDIFNNELIVITYPIIIDCWVR